MFPGIRAKKGLGFSRWIPFQFLRAPPCPVYGLFKYSKDYCLHLRLSAFKQWGVLTGQHFLSDVCLVRWLELVEVRIGSYYPKNISLPFFTEVSEMKFKCADIDSMPVPNDRVRASKRPSNNASFSKMCITTRTKPSSKQARCLFCPCYETLEQIAGASSLVTLSVYL